MAFGLDDIAGAIGISPGLLSAGAGVVGTLYQNHSAHLENEWARDWQKMMSDTSHRREVKDLVAAGLNPILSVNKGASTPSTSASPVSDPVQGGFSSAMQQATYEKTQADIALTKQTQAVQAVTQDKIVAETNNIASQTELNNQTMDKIVEEIKNLAESRDLTIEQRRRVKQEVENLEVELNILRSENRLKRAQVPGAETEGAIDESPVGKVLRAVKRIRDSLGIGNSSTIDHNYHLDRSPKKGK